MPNPLQPYVSTTCVADTYRRIQRNLGQDHFIFSAMNQVAQRRDFLFDEPASRSEYPQKHQEIENYLTRYQEVLDREGLFFELVEETQSQLLTDGEVIHEERLRRLAILETNRDFKIRLSADGAWLVEWVVSVVSDYGSSDDREIIVATYKYLWEHIVPWPVFQYLNSGIQLYRQKENATALALMSIAVEATLRDVLSTRGYGYSPSASAVDVYKYSRAQVDSSGAGYSLTFLENMPLSPSDLLASAGGALPVEIEVRRRINPRDHRVDLLIKDPQCLVGHWSSDQIVQDASHSIGGLGAALRIARETERIITSRDLPPDIDDVLKAVRNNLIHLSRESMGVLLPRYASRSPTGHFTIKDFVSRPRMVFDLITDIPRFVNEQYVKLWKDGVHL